ncbi:MAG: hypothetical protein MJE77_31125 [Proteobacteria bacterium]|nr:hypothetical protein [Pseudomonadota bacterium]
MTGTQCTVAAGLVLASSLSIPRVARAQPSPSTGAAIVVETRFDVDRDGMLDTIRLERPAAISVVFSAPGQSARGTAWKPFATSGLELVGGTITAAPDRSHGGRTVIAAVAQFGRGDIRRPGAGLAAEEAMVVTWQNNALATLWTGMVGRKGSDSSYRVMVEATPQGLFRYQTRPDVQRCDGRPAYLFPERYDVGQKRFRSVYNAPRVARNAPLLVAQPGRSPDAGTRRRAGGEPIRAIAFRSRAASTQAGAEHAGDLVPPRELDDGDLRTSWREVLGGNGRGEFITFTTPVAAPVIAALRIVPGDTSSRESFRRSNRLRRAGLLIGKKLAYWIEINRDPALARDFDQPYWVTLPAGVRARCVTLVIDATYPGSAAASPRSGDTALSEVAVFTELELTPGGAEAALAARVAAGGDGGRTAAQLLLGQGDRAIAALLAAAESSGRTSRQAMRSRVHTERSGRPAGGLDKSGKELVRIRRALAQIALRMTGNRASRPRLPPATERDRGPVDSAAVDSSGDNPGHQLLEQLAEQLAEGLASSGITEPDRRLFGDALIGLGGPAVAVLASFFGESEGSSEARRRAAGVLARIADDRARDALVAACGRGNRAVRKAISIALSRRATRDLAVLLDAVGRASRAGETAREADLWRALGLMARRAPGDRRAMVVEAARQRLPAVSGYELHYRLVAVVGTLGGADALDDLARALAALDQTSPLRRARARALRRVAARAVADNPDARARGLLVELSRDPDPGVRGRAIAGIGQRDDADSTTDRAIISHIDRDRWPRIRRAAAAALARRCGRPGPAASALYRAVARDRQVEVRRAALTALVECRSPGVGPRLIAVARDRQQPAPVRERAIGLVATLGDSSLTGELIALFAALRNEAWSSRPAVRLAAAAAVAMGRLGGKGVLAPLLGAAREGSFPEIQAAAVTGLGEMCPAQAMALLGQLMSSSQPAVAVAARGARNGCRRSNRQPQGD